MNAAHQAKLEELKTQINEVDRKSSEYCLVSWFLTWWWIADCDFTTRSGSEPGREVCGGESSLSAGGREERGWEALCRLPTPLSPPRSPQQPPRSLTMHNADKVSTINSWKHRWRPILSARYAMSSPAPPSTSVRRDISSAQVEIRLLNLIVLFSVIFKAIPTSGFWSCCWRWCWCWCYCWCWRPFNIVDKPLPSVQAVAEGMPPVRHQVHGPSDQVQTGSDQIIS